MPGICFAARSSYELRALCSASSPKFFGGFSIRNLRFLLAKSWSPKGKPTSSGVQLFLRSSQASKIGGTRRSETGLWLKKLGPLLKGTLFLLTPSLSFAPTNQVNFERTLPFPFFPGIRDPFQEAIRTPGGSSDRLLKRRMVEKNGRNEQIENSPTSGSRR